MRAIVIDRFGGPEELVARDLPEPQPGAGEVRVRVVAAAVNPVDLQTRAGTYADYMRALSFPMILGWDLAGVVEALGPGVEGRAIGDRVIALSARAGDEPAAAAALPLAAVMALQALRALGLVAGQTLFVTGAVGAVGGFAVQLAAHAGVQTLVQVSGKDADLAATLGAGRVLVREDGAGSSALRHERVDGLLDTVGAAQIAAVRDEGRYVSIVPGALPSAERGIVPEMCSASEDGADLLAVSRLVDEGVLTLRIARELPLAAAQDAHRLLGAGGLPGKILLRP